MRWQITYGKKENSERKKGGGVPFSGWGIKKHSPAPKGARSTPTNHPEMPHRTPTDRFPHGRFSICVRAQRQVPLIDPHTDISGWDPTTPVVLVQAYRASIDVFPHGRLSVRAGTQRQVPLTGYCSGWPGCHRDRLDTGLPGPAALSVDRWVPPWSTLGGSCHPALGSPNWVLLRLHQDKHRRYCYRTQLNLTISQPYPTVPNQT